MDLDRAGDALLTAVDARGVEDHQHVVVVDVDLRALAELARVLERERVHAQLLADAGQLVVRRRLQVEPEELVPPEVVGDPRAVERCEDVHENGFACQASELLRRCSPSATLPAGRCAKPYRNRPEAPLASGAYDGRRDLRRGTREVVRLGARPLWRGLRRTAGERPRPARPERGRQDHRCADPGHAAQARRRACARGGAGRREGRGRPAGPDRARRPVRGRRREPHRLREPRDGGAAVPHEQGGRARPRERAARALRPRGGGEAPGQDVLRRHAPAARPRAPRSSTGRRCCSSTSRPPAWTRAAGSRCGRRSRPAPRPARPCCSPPSTSTRPTASRTGSS